MIEIQGIDHVALAVLDLESAESRLCAELGLTHVAREADRSFLACELEGCALELVRAHMAGHDHTAWRLARGWSIAAAARALDEAGVAYTHRDGALALLDPDGHAVELVEDTSDPAAFPSVALRSTGLPGLHPRRLGHSSGLTADLDAATAFYTNVLGLRVSDWLVDDDGRAIGAWFSCGSDHHVHSLVETGAREFHHLALELVDWGELRVALDHLAQHGRWLSWGPVRHGIGRNVAAYVRLPELRCHVELYCDMEQLVPGHEPRRWADTPHSSNVWGILPPRSYFRFDDSAVEAERLQLEAQGTILEPVVR